MPDAQLRLLAHDSEDLSVFSAHLQAAAVRAGDMAFLPGARRFALAGSRFNLLALAAGRVERVAVGVHFDSVLAVARAGFDPADADAILNLHSIEFIPGEAPGGEVHLDFSDGAAVRLTVECVDAQLRDLGPRWQTTDEPGAAAAD